MRALLDTHTIAWALLSPDELGPGARDIIEDPDNEIFFSPASAYELIFKHKTGRWPEVGVIAADFIGQLTVEGWSEIPITTQHLSFAGQLPLVHRDPFDRILAAQASVTGMPILSTDDAIDQFPVTRIW